jgi:hypothetical protein
MILAALAAFCWSNVTVQRLAAIAFFLGGVLFFVIGTRCSCRGDELIIALTGAAIDARHGPDLRLVTPEHRFRRVGDS